jgi:hypothetical protein
VKRAPQVNSSPLGYRSRFLGWFEFSTKSNRRLSLRELVIVLTTGVGLQKGAAVSPDGCNRRMSDDQTNYWLGGKAICAYFLKVT